VENPIEGKVYLVGSGPGDPGLLTVKASQILKECDVLLYDRLVTDDILDIVPENCEKIYVGKHPGEASSTQEEINKLLVDRGRKGGVVVRLKGGDPFLFGRGGEEAIKLREAGISFEVIPGISSAIAVPAYAGIPVTHRNLSSSVAFITGHESETKENSSVNWIGLANCVDTLVVLMGIGNMPAIMKRLTEAGRSPDTPVAVIEKGTTPNQRTIVGTIETIHEKTLKARVSPPALTIIGKVVELRREISWFEK
jgi:uroporphyrinogen III methyltransferase/synthase